MGRPTMKEIIDLARASDELRAFLVGIEKDRAPSWRYESPEFWAMCIALGEAAKRMGTGQSH